MITKLNFINHDAASRYKVIMTSKSMKRKFFVPAGMVMPVVLGRDKNAGVANFGQGQIAVIVLVGDKQVHSCAINAGPDGSFRHGDEFLTVSQEPNDG